MNFSRVGPNIKVSTIVSVDLSADQWQLYTSQYPRKTIERVAYFLNKRFTDGFNKGLSADTLEVYVGGLMEDFRKFGANDSEPRAVLRDLIEKAYHT